MATLAVNVPSDCAETLLELTRRHLRDMQAQAEMCRRTFGNGHPDTARAMHQRQLAASLNAAAHDALQPESPPCLLTP